MALALAMQWLVIIFFCSLTGFFNLLSTKWFSCKSKNCHSNLLSSSKIMKWIETLNVLLWMATWIATGFVEVRYGLWNPVLWFCHVWHMTFIIKYVSIGFDSLFNIKWFWYEIVQGEAWSYHLGARTNFVGLCFQTDWTIFLLFHSPVVYKHKLLCIFVYKCSYQ